MASGFSRLARCSICLDFRSAMFVTEQVLTTYTSARSVNGTISYPALSKISRIASAS